MHECNAMQILETKRKNTKTKEQWPQRKSNEAQGPRNQNSSGTQNHTNYLTKGFKLTSIKRFGENVGVRDRAPGPFYDIVGPNPREWVESCYCLSKWRFD